MSAQDEYVKDVDGVLARALAGVSGPEVRRELEYVLGQTSSDHWDTDILLAERAAHLARTIDPASIFVEELLLTAEAVEALMDKHLGSIRPGAIEAPATR